MRKLKNDHLRIARLLTRIGPGDGISTDFCFATRRYFEVDFFSLIRHQTTVSVKLEQLIGSAIVTRAYF